jgi:hypothetical protein
MPNRRLTRRTSSFSSHPGIHAAVPPVKTCQGKSTQKTW